MDVQGFECTLQSRFFRMYADTNDFVQYVLVDLNILLENIYIKLVLEVLKLLSLLVYHMFFYVCDHEGRHLQRDPFLMLWLSRHKHKGHGFSKLLDIDLK